MIWVGKEGLRIYNTWELTEAQRTVETLWERYTDILQPKSNHRLNRFNLQRYRQEISESVDEFMTRCKLQAKKCQFQDARETDERLIEQLIVGIKHAKIQEKLLGRDDMLKLDSAMDIAQTYEATLADMHTFSNESAVHHVRHQPMNQRHVTRETCKFCGGHHRPGRDNCHEL